MFNRRPALRRWLGIVSLASLLLVPLALNGHRHADHAATARPCAVCVVAHHAPLTSIPVVTSIVLALAGMVAFLLPAVAPAVHQRSPAAGRAPPLAVAVLPA